MPEIRLDDGRSVPYTIRVSRRSRRVRLTLNPRDGLVLVTPPGVERVWLTDLATSWRGWVARQLDNMGIPDADDSANKAPMLPQRIALPAVAESWDVIYRYTPSGSPRVLHSQGGALLLSGDCADVASCQRALRRWLARRAKELLPPMLEQLSRQTGLRYNSVAIRGQRSRWGSCSVQGDITLNQQLLLLPPELARHVLLHELCHTVELNHSARFWQTVQRFEPELDARRAEMHRSWSHVPAWALN